ncbi:hypothetical protein [Pseudomonas sp. 1176_21]|uniref:hypothetical protein n=1 Tax=Pseudomonas sp. 1176_21 TaxID=2604453 RepID=UPI00406458DA
MLKDVDGLLQHWGEQSKRLGLGAGLGSQMGSIMEWKGNAPRGTPGARILIGGAGLDHIAAEVDAALAELHRRDARGKVLVKLARFRYLHAVSIREQMREVGLHEDADRTYRNWIRALHQQVLLILTIRTCRPHTARRDGVRRSGVELASKVSRSE